MNLLNCLFFIIIINFLIIYSTQYQIMFTESSDLCSKIKKRKIKLTNNGDHSGLIVRQYNYNYHPIDWQINFFCHFQIKLDSSSILSPYNNNNGGIIAIIQYLNFRYNQTIDNCLDFIQFYRKDGTSSRKFCGHIDALIDMEKINHNNQQLQLNDDLILTSNSFIDNKGEMDVHIFINKQAIEFDKQMDLGIVFTAYKNCPSRWKDKDYDLKPCSDNARKYCIYSGFFNDTIINCPYQHCVDEYGCLKGQKSIEISTNSQQIFYGALSSVFISFFIFIICILIFRAKEILCFNQNCYQSSTHNNNNNNREIVEQEFNPERTIEMDDQITLNRNTTTTTRTTTAPTSSEDDKDLPPAYETLFPDR